MGATTIEWTDQTWNPVSGCSKVSQGCKHCYAERHWSRLSAPGQPYEGRKFTDVRCHSERLMDPTRWRKERMVFVNSMSDLFHDDVPIEFIDQVFAMMAFSWPHTFQVLTKRPARMLEYLNSLPARIGKGKRYLVIDFDDPERVMSVFRGKEWPIPNVWLGVSVEDQVAADERVPMLLQTPAAVRFVSAEPLLGPVDLAIAGALGCDCVSDDRCFGSCSFYQNSIDKKRIDWVIVGGESGPRARPMHPEWVRGLRDQCQAAGVPFFFKQWGAWAPLLPTDPHVKPSTQRAEVYGKPVFKVGMKIAGRTIDGQTWNEYPASSTTDSDDDGRHRQHERCGTEQGGAELESKAALQEDWQ